MVIRSEERRLNSWKEIASYFGNDVRTVKRWEHTRGLPVRRLPGARSGVFALADELEAWQRGDMVAVAPGLETADETAELAGDPVDDAEDEQDLAMPVESAPVVLPPTGAAPVEAVARKGHSGWWIAAVFVVMVTGAGMLAWTTLRGVHAKGPSVLAGAAHVPLAQAKELYLKGRFHWNKRTPEDLQTAMALFKQAAALDPQYAAAYAGMADCLALTPEFADVHGATVYPEMYRLASHALELDPELAEGHRAVGFAVFYWMRDVERARREFGRALELMPRDATTHLWFANTLATTGAFDEALREVEQARELDPGSVSIEVDRGWILYEDGRHAEAEELWRGVEKMDPNYMMAHVWNSFAMLDEGRMGEYLAERRSIAELGGHEPDRVRLEAAEQGLRTGGKAGLLGALADAEAGLYARKLTTAYAVACAMNRAGRSEQTIDYLEHATADGDESTVTLASPHAFPALRGNARFEAILKRRADGDARLAASAVTPGP